MVDLGGALAMVLLTLTQKHPMQDRPLVDFDLLTLISLPMLFGAFWGAIIRSVFPPWLSLVYAVWMFGHLAYHALVK